MPNDLKLLIGKGGNQRIDIAIISACHSEPFGEVFLDAGIKCVVTV